MARHTNAEFAQKNTTFRRHCQQANIPPTARQASKYRNGRRGKALQAYHESKKTQNAVKQPRCKNCGRFVGKNSPGYNVAWNEEGFYEDRGSYCKKCIR